MNMPYGQQTTTQLLYRRSSERDMAHQLPPGTKSLEALELPNRFLLIS